MTTSKQSTLTSKQAKQLRAAEKKATATLNPCQCGCGAEVRNRFKPGHDAVLKSALLKRYDAGDEAAGIELMNFGWYSNDQLEERQERSEAKAKTKLQRQIDREEKARVNAEAKAAKKQTQSTKTAAAGREAARKQQEQVAATA